MQAVSTNIKIDRDVTAQAQELFESLGMNLSTVVNIFLHQAIRERAIPFHVREGFYAKSNMDYLRSVTSEIDSRKAVLREHELIEANMKLTWDDRGWDD